MAAPQNKGLQFFITMAVFLLLFFGFYYFILNKDKKDDTAAVDFGAAYINDGAAYISGIKAETPKKIAVAYRIAFSTSGDGLYYIDNYAKLKYYDIASGDSKDVFINVADFRGLSFRRYNRRGGKGRVRPSQDSLRGRR